jgi:hypothetical protein
MRPWRIGFCALLAVLIVGRVQGAVMTHLYRIDGDYHDDCGGPDLVPAGGTLNSNAYSFAANQGLSLSNALALPGGYSIEMVFSLSDLNDYRKIIDYRNLLLDAGLYSHYSSTDHGYLNLFPRAQSASKVFTAGQTAHLVVTRDASTNAFVGYVNGVQAISFNDSSNDAVFSAANNIIQFFKDDTPTGSREASPGTVEWIQIYDGALTANEVARLSAAQPGGAVPEPSSLVLWSGFGAMVVVMAWRRRGRAA